MARISDIVRQQASCPTRWSFCHLCSFFFGSLDFNVCLCFCPAMPLSSTAFRNLFPIMFFVPSSLILSVASLPCCCPFFLSGSLNGEHKDGWATALHHNVFAQAHLPLSAPHPIPNISPVHLPGRALKLLIHVSLYIHIYVHTCIYVFMYVNTYIYNIYIYVVYFRDR